MKKISVSDLSIGDWVCAEQLCGVHSEPRLTPPMKVVGLGESWVNLEIDPEQGDPFEFEPSEIRGVPITAEVLEKNGFEQNANCLDYRFIIGKIYCSISKGIKCWYVNIYDISDSPHTPIFKAHIIHIHELQHALRLAKTGKEIEL